MRGSITTSPRNSESRRFCPDTLFNTKSGAAVPVSCAAAIATPTSSVHAAAVNALKLTARRIMVGRTP